VINQKTDRDNEDMQQLQENPNAPSPEQLKRAYETVYLLKWLFPPHQAISSFEPPQPTYTHFTNQFNVQSQSQ
jgi:hypothetical protein